MSRRLDLFLFSADPRLIVAAVAGGAAGVVVDWETRGKAARQAGADTQINHHTPEDLRRARECTRARVICRINQFGPQTSGEVEAAVAAGADEVLLPMVRGPDEVRDVLGLAAGRAGVGILVETRDAVERAGALARLPICRAYVGLNDLAIERGTPDIFAAVLDGTVAKVRAHFRAPFGFAGLTLPDRGAPIPCRLLMAELLRLRCEFTFLRRSFLRDAGADPGAAIRRIAAAVEAAGGRSPREEARDRRLLAEAIRGRGAATGPCAAA